MVKRVLKIYIAGPMTGYPDYNRAAFNAKASELMAEGHIVLNPAVLLGVSAPARATGISNGLPRF